MVDLEAYRKKVEQMTGAELYEEKLRLKKEYSLSARDSEKWAEGQELSKVYIDVQYKKAKARFGSKATKQSLHGFLR